MSPLKRRRYSISIHTLREEDDIKSKYTTGGKLIISIHTLREEDDLDDGR